VGKKKISHRGFFRDRLRAKSGDLEKAFADNWEKDCREHYVLENILNHKGSPETTQRDAIIAATVIQWLGTNVGFGFIMKSIKECGYVVNSLPKMSPRRMPKKKSSSKKIKRMANGG